MAGRLASGCDSSGLAHAGAPDAPLTPALRNADILSMALRGFFLLLLVPYGLWLALAYDYHFLDGVNLLFHEAGHVFFGLLGETIGILGGTLGQFIFPTAAGVHFLLRGKQFDAAVCALWFGENLMYTARYMADARAMVLPVVGGDVHDWNLLLSRWGLLDQCDALARAAHLLGSLIVLGAIGKATGILWREWRVRTPSGTSPSPDRSS